MTVADRTSPEVDRIITRESRSAEEDKLLATLRPTSLNDFIGQDVLKKRLGISIESARIRGVQLDHALFSGPKGLGKSSLSSIIANEMGGRLVQTSAPMLEKGSDLVGLLTSLEDGDVFLIDEIHSLGKQMAEILYIAMEDFRVDFVVGSGSEAKALQVPLGHFTLVGATTRKGGIPGPMLDRFGLQFGMVFYDSVSLAQIVKRSALLLGLQIEDSAAEQIAQRSRGTPRIANRLLRRVQDFSVVFHESVISQQIVQESLSLEGIDQHGLDDLDRAYLRALVTTYRGGPVGVASIAATIQEDASTLVDVVEPFLLYQQFIVRSPGGRRATEKGKRSIQS